MRFVSVPVLIEVVELYFLVGVFLNVIENTETFSVSSLVSQIYHFLISVQQMVVSVRSGFDFQFVSINIVYADVSLSSAFGTSFEYHNIFRTG